MYAVLILVVMAMAVAGIGVLVDTIHIVRRSIRRRKGET